MFNNFVLKTTKPRVTSQSAEDPRAQNRSSDNLRNDRYNTNKSRLAAHLRGFFFLFLMTGWLKGLTLTVILRGIVHSALAKI